MRYFFWGFQIINKKLHGRLFCFVIPIFLIENREFLVEWLFFKLNDFLQRIEKTRRKRMVKHTVKICRQRPNWARSPKVIDCELCPLCPSVLFWLVIFFLIFHKNCWWFLQLLLRFFLNFDAQEIQIKCVLKNAFFFG